MADVLALTVQPLPASLQCKILGALGAQGELEGVKKCGWKSAPSVKGFNTFIFCYHQEAIHNSFCGAGAIREVKLIMPESSSCEATRIIELHEANYQYISISVPRCYQSLNSKKSDAIVMITSLSAEYLPAC